MSLLAVSLHNLGGLTVYKDRFHFSDLAREDEPKCRPLRVAYVAGVLALAAFTGYSFDELVPVATSAVSYVRNVALMPADIEGAAKACLAGTPRGSEASPYCKKIVRAWAERDGMEPVMKFALAQALIEGLNSRR